MEWILIGFVAGTLVVSPFKDKEACNGRVATLKEQKVEAKCYEAPKAALGYTCCTSGTGTTQLFCGNPC